MVAVALTSPNAHALSDMRCLLTGLLHCVASCMRCEEAHVGELR